MSLSQTALSALAIGASLVALLALAAVFVLARRMRRVRRLAGMVRRNGNGGDLASAMDRQADATGALAREVQNLGGEVAALRDAVARSVQRVGLVRFDAFEDMGGRLSFAAALLDEDGNGIVFSSINGRSETRIYAKPIDRGSSRYNLSEEEVEAIRRALAGAPV